jgi:hypothetical protein
LQKKDDNKSQSDDSLFKSVVKLDGHWRAVLKDEYGNYKTHVEGHNVVCTNGLEFFARFIHSATTSSVWSMKYIGIGTNTTTEAASNTALGTEISRHTSTVSYTSGAIITVVGTFGAGSGTGDVTEYGIFSANSSGTMLNRTTQSAIAKGASDTLEVTVNVTLG